MGLRPMESSHKNSKNHLAGPVELTRVQPIEAQVIVARLRASGIAAIVGADSVYPSVTFADGVPVLVSADDVAQARAILEDPDD
jgi:Putative prokaryotic signal transducing protein